jgi:hypothetical protein
MFLRSLKVSSPEKRTNQPTNQLTNQPTTHPSRQAGRQAGGRAGGQPGSQWTNQRTTQPTKQPTNSLEQSPYLEAGGFSFSQELLYKLWKCVNKIPHLAFILIQTNPFCTLPLDLFKICFNAVFSSTSVYSERSFSLTFSYETVVHISPLFYACHISHPILSSYHSAVQFHIFLTLSYRNLKASCLSEKYLPISYFNVINLFVVYLSTLSEIKVM